jgi:hypothetical protein
MIITFALLGALVIYLAIDKPEVLRRTWDFMETGAKLVVMRPPSEKKVTGMLAKVNENYGAEVDKYALKFGFSPAYLKALIVLECGGNKPAGHRFEKHVYHRLKRLKSGELKKYENLTPKDLHDATDEALRNMATSWGPFQVMGYKCTFLDVQLKDLRGDSSVYWGIKWISLTYGDYLKKGKYRDAFHIHNTGHPYPATGPPKTYDPRYVSNGLNYMEQF